MARGITPLQANFPIPEDFIATITAMQSGALERLFDCVWIGFDEVKERRFDVTEADENIERGITQFICQPIRDALGVDAPFYLEHHPFEDETRITAGGAPPAPDLAFILRS